MAMGRINVSSLQGFFDVIRVFHYNSVDVQFNLGNVILNRQ